MRTPLRLLAHDQDDLAVISAALQDALLHVGDMVYQSRQHRFAAVLNRFCWEELKETKTKKSLFGKPIYHRVQTGLHFEDVRKVRSQYIALDKKDAVLSLLSLTVEDMEDGYQLVTLAFAGGGTIQIEAECVNASLQDISEPWKTQNLPEHEVDDNNVKK